MVLTDIRPIASAGNSINFSEIKDKNNSKSIFELLYQFLKSPFSKNGLSNLINIGKNVCIAAYDQRNLPFGSKLKKFFSPMNILSLLHSFIKCMSEGRTVFETTKTMAKEIIKIFSGMFFCHITTSIMEKLVAKFLTKKLGQLIATCCLSFAFPPAPLLLFLCDIIISWLGGKLVDLIVYLYKKYLSQYVQAAFNWVKDKAIRAWRWFTGLFN